MEKLQSTQQFSQLTNNSSVIFMFTAGWCPDCRVIDPIMPEIENKFSEYQFVSVDRDEFIDLCIDNDIYVAHPLFIIECIHFLSFSLSGLFFARMNIGSSVPFS